MSLIHPTAIIDRRAELAADVEIGPYAVIEGRVSIGKGTRIESHSILRGHTVIGAACKIGPAAHVGLDPQHLKFDGSETSLIIGDNVIIRESASIHRAFKPGQEHATRIGDRCFLMGASHVAHDCRLGDDVILANNVMLGGHVSVAERTFLGGGTGVHQFVQIGRLVIIAGNESISRDIPPFAAVRYGGMKGYNAIGCRRAGISQASIHAIRRTFHCLHTHRTIPAAVKAIEASPDAQAPEVQELLHFIATAKRGIQPSVRSLRAMTNNPDDD
ncbi:MAG TPA: acyl-ACP--UDP-N-acetylglucosamine O-acyltransferase [Tepidisphaeraceae bacterium]|jgi:UDP-N-acetylglucosamine acyltransferase|nr:acyl-ACP--UDP-N-acetylglucosamine O-acyltransferase [Tepidisphaeraceae bacterium]